MTGIAYTAIESEIVSILREALGSGVVVTAEVEQPLETKPWVAVYLDRRDAPAEQPIAAGKRMRMTVRFGVWCWCWSLDSSAKAAEARDDLLTDVETVLIGNRSLNGKVLTSWIEGGDFVATTWESEGVSGPAYLSGAEVSLMAEVMASV